MPYDQRLPAVAGDDGTWGNILNQFLEKEHVNTGTNSSGNGGHKTITIQAGTAASGTAPLKLTSGTSLTSSEAGAMEYDGNELYFTLSDLVRRTIAMYDDTSGALGDIYYRNSTGSLTRLAIGTFPQTLSISSGTPSWSASYSITSNTTLSGNVTPTGSSRQNEYFLTALASSITFKAQTVATNGNLLLIRIKDNNSAQSLGWDTGVSGGYRGVARSLPAATTASKTMYLGFKYNSADSIWDLIAYAEEG